MPRYTLVVERLPGTWSSRSIGIDAAHAVSAILGVADVQIESESEASTVISYEWSLDKQKFWDIQTHLAGYGLTRMDLKEEN